MWTSWQASARSSGRILQLETPTRRGPFYLVAIGRLRAGVSLAQARRDLASVSERIFPIWSAGFQDREARLTPYALGEIVVGDAARGLRLFGVAVGLVLLIAVANVANLVLARASGRRREMAVRAALGARRGRLGRLLLTESTVLGLLGGGVGVGVAALGIRGLAAVNPGLPRLATIGVDWRTVAFAALVALVSGALVGAYPLALGASRDLATPLRGSDRRTGAGTGAKRLQTALVVAEFALALPLLVTAGLLLRSVARLQQVDPGFDPAGLVALRVSLPSAGYPDAGAMQRFWDEARRRVAGVPGVDAVALTSMLPPQEDARLNLNNFDLLDRPVASGGRQPVSPWSTASPDLFTALGVPLLEGRLLTPRDDSLASPVVVVSRSWARRFYPGESAVGKRMVAGGCVECPPTTVVGVVGDVKFQGLAGAGDAVYDPYPQAPQRSMYLVARTRLRPAALQRAVEARIRALDPDLPIGSAETLEERVRASVAAPRHWTLLLGAFAGAAVALAAVGIFGVMSYIVRQQAPEIGVRMALGAEPAAVLRWVVRRGLGRAAAGLGLGVLGSVLGVRLVRGFLFATSPADPVTWAAVAGGLLAVAALACLLPGRRAARIDPVRAMDGG